MFALLYHDRCCEPIQIDTKKETKYEKYNFHSGNAKWIWGEVNKINKPQKYHKMLQHVETFENWIHLLAQALNTNRYYQKTTSAMVAMQW